MVTSPGFVKRKVVCEMAKTLNGELIVFSEVTTNPEWADIRLCLQTVHDKPITAVIALGGGSAIDTAKVVTTELHKIYAQSLSPKTFPALVAIPTTSGTGAEVTPFATIWDHQQRKKLSFSTDVPDKVILNPSLTLTCPPDVTLFCGLDALSHSVESLWNKYSTEESLHYAQEAIPDICHTLPIVMRDSQNLEARSAMQLASTKAGMAIAINKTAIAHAISYPLTLKFGVPHGLACSFSLVGIIEVFGAKSLKMSATTADMIKETLINLDVRSKLAHYCSLDEILESVSENLDPARAGNFVMTVDSGKIQDILQASLV